MLNTVKTHCSYCKEETPEKILASNIIKKLPENESFGGTLKIVECKKCGLRYLNPMPAPQELSKIYDYDVYHDSTNFNPVLQEYFYNILDTYCKELKSVLEIGCGTGDFLAVLEKKGINVSGVEFADSGQRVKFQGKLYLGKMEDIDIKDKTFDAVMLLNVIEHLSDPVDVIARTNNFLNENGILILRNPNSDLFFNPFYKYLVEIPKYIFHQILYLMGKRTRFTILGFQNQHLFYFNKNSLNMLLDKAGYRLEYFTTADPFNYYRIKKSLRQGNFIETIIASVRHLLGYVGLGPECIVVARKKA